MSQLKTILAFLAAVILLGAIWLFVSSPKGLSGDEATNATAKTETLASKPVRTKPVLPKPISDLDLPQDVSPQEIADARSMSAELDVLGDLDLAPLPEDMPPGEAGERLMSEVTAHMSDAELVKFRQMREQSVLVRDTAGKLASSYRTKQQCIKSDGQKICSDIIIDAKTKAIVFDGAWADGFVVTGLGKEVVRVK